MSDRENRDAKHTVTGKEPSLPPTASAPQPINPETKQHGDHWVLSESERSNGYIRPVRVSYVHTVCGTSTRMPLAIAQTYAKQPSYYGATFCCFCKQYLPVGEHGQFVWDDGSKVGT